MRANVADAKFATDSNPLTVSAYLGAPAEKKNCTTAAGCTPTEMAQNDLFEWQQEIIDALGVRASGIVTYHPANGFFNISITWDDNRDADVDGHIGPRNGDTDGDDDTDDDPMYQMTFKL
jgi:type IV pilus assembly protein PilV